MINHQILTTIMHTFTVPSPVVEVTSIDTVEYGKVATLECNAFAVRGITSRVDIIWMTGYFNTVVKRRVNVTANIVNNLAVYTDLLMTPPQSINDNGRVYHCVVNITATSLVTSSDNIVLSFNGKL